MATGFQILSIRQRTDMVVPGQFSQVYEIQFQSAKGATGRITVPVSEYEPTKARKMAEDEAKKLDAIFG